MKQLQCVDFHIFSVLFSVLFWKNLNKENGNFKKKYKHVVAGQPLLKVDLQVTTAVLWLHVKHDFLSPGSSSAPFSGLGPLPPIFPYYILMLFIMRLLQASCHLEEGPAAGSDKWITDGIHPPGQTGPVDNRIRDRLPTRISKKFRLTERKVKVKTGRQMGDKTKAFSKVFTGQAGQNHQAW